MKTLILAFLIIGAGTQALAEDAGGIRGWLESYNNPTLTTLGGVKVTKKALESAIAKRFQAEARVRGIYRNWETWGPKYVFQDFLGVSLFSRDVQFSLSYKDPRAYENFACRLHVMQTTHDYRVLLRNCEGNNPKSKTAVVDITEEVRAASPRVVP